MKSKRKPKKKFIGIGLLLILLLTIFFSTKKTCENIIMQIPNKLFYDNPLESKISPQDLEKILEENENSDILLIGNTEDGLLYPKRELRMLAKQYEITLQEDMFEVAINFSVINTFLKQLWKLCILIGLLPLMIWGIAMTTKNYMKFYNFFVDRREINYGFLVKGTIYTGVLFLLWYGILSQLYIPGQLLPENNILDIGYYWREIKEFLRIAKETQNSFLQLQMRCGTVAVIGYGSTILIGWVMFFLGVRKKKGVVDQ